MPSDLPYAQVKPDQTKCLSETYFITIENELLPFLGLKKASASKYRNDDNYKGQPRMFQVSRVRKDWGGTVQSRSGCLHSLPTRGQKSWGSTTRSCSGCLISLRTRWRKGWGGTVQSRSGRLCSLRTQGRKGWGDTTRSCSGRLRN